MWSRLTSVNYRQSVCENERKAFQHHLPLCLRNRSMLSTLIMGGCVNRVVTGRPKHTYRKSSWMFPLNVPHNPTVSSFQRSSACKYRRKSFQLYCRRRPNVVFTWRNMEDNSWTRKTSVGRYTDMVVRINLGFGLQTFIKKMLKNTGLNTAG